MKKRYDTKVEIKQGPSSTSQERFQKIIIYSLHLKKNLRITNYKGKKLNRPQLTKWKVTNWLLIQSTLIKSSLIHHVLQDRYKWEWISSLLKRMNRFEDGSFSVINSCKCIKLGLELEGLSGACWPKPVIPLPGSTSPAASWNSPT